MKTFLPRAGSLFIIALVLLNSCRKNVVPLPIISSTPLYALIIGDTDLSVFNAAIQKAGDSALFHGIDSITVLFPTNNALLSAGITMSSINAMPVKSLDSLVRYHYLDTAVILTDSLYTVYNSLLGPAIYGYGGTDSTDIYFNGNRAVLQKLPGSNALVYKLDALLRVPYSSITGLLSADTSLTYFAEALHHTGLNIIPVSGWNTILAPDNNAFIAAGFTTLTDIDNADATSLANILQYHILPGQYFTNNFHGLSTVTTVNSNSINVTFTDSLVQFTGSSNTAAASLIQGNKIAGTNIIVQKINGVLMP